MQPMTFRFDCKHCGQMIEADASVAGKTIACPWCDNPLQLRNAMRQPRKPNKLLLLLCLTLVGAMAFGLFKLGISFSNEGASPDQALDKKDGRLSFTTNGKDVDIPQRTLRELATAMYNTMFPKSLVGELGIDDPSRKVTGVISEVSSNGGKMTQMLSKTFVARNKIQRPANILEHFGKPSRIVGEAGELDQNSDEAMRNADWHYLFLVEDLEFIFLSINIRNGFVEGGKIKSEGIACSQLVP